MKSLITSIAGVGFLAPLAMHAQDVLYEPMVSLPGVPEGGVTFASYAPAIFQLVIGLGGVLAVIMIVIGGIQLVGSGANESWRKEGKEKIWNAVFGLIGMALIWIVLNLINPNLVNVDLALPDAPAPIAPTYQAAPGGTPQAIYQPVPSESEQAVRNQLLAAGITIPKSACPENTAYQEIPGGCTSVGGLPAGTVSELIALKSSCNCDIIITGGSELGHRSHGPMRSRVDLRLTPSLATYLAQQAPSTQGSSCALGPRHVVNGNTFVNEAGGDPHWHVCF